MSPQPGSCVVVVVSVVRAEREAVPCVVVTKNSAKSKNSAADILRDVFQIAVQFCKIEKLW